MNRAPRRRGAARVTDPAALAARLPEELRSMAGHTHPRDYLAAVRDWMQAQGIPMPTFEEALQGVEAPVSVSDVTEAAGVPAVLEYFKHQMRQRDAYLHASWCANRIPG